MEFKLPNTVISYADMMRLARELDRLEDFFTGAANRPPGSPQAAPPRLTRSLDQVAQENKLNLLDAGDRHKLVDMLKKLQAVAPRLHISFASEPSPLGLERILTWFRTNIHPYALIQVGLQPGIAAGCVLRTPNRQFDMSLRSYLNGQEEYLGRLIQVAATATSEQAPTGKEVKA